MKEYQYILTYGATVETLGYNPAGWDKLGITWMRHEVYHSVLRSFTLSLRFPNIRRGGLTGGYQLIKTAYDTDGIYAEVSVQIKKRNPDTNDYDSLYTGVLDFTPGRWSIDRDLFWEISINDSSVLQKFISRDENEINLISVKTLDNETILTLDPSEIDLTPVDIVVKYIAELQMDVSGDRLSLQRGDIFPILYSGVFDEESIADVTVNQIERVTIGGTYGYSDTSLFEKIYTNDQIDTKKIKIIFDIDYSQMITISSLSNGTYTEKIIFKHYDELDSLKATSTTTVKTEAYTTGNNDYSSDGNVVGSVVFTDVDEGDYIKGYYVIDCTTNVTQINLDYYPLSSTPPLICNIEIAETTFGKASSPIGSFFPFAAFNNALKILTGVDDSLVSTVMDTGGALEYDAITNGYSIRRYPAPKINLKFRSLFKSFDAIANLGLWYDKTNNQFIIESKSTFFKSELLFHLSGVSKFKIQPYVNAYYNKIMGGFDNTGDYEKVQGALEFAVKREYSTSAPVKEDKNIESPYRCDSVKIEELRNLQYIGAATEDNDADNHIFIIRTDGSEPILPTVGSPEYLGMDVFYSYYNTMLTPRQNAVRWGNVIKSCVYHNTNPILAQKTEKQFELEVDGIDENSDIAVSELGEALYIPELYVFESYLTPTNIQSLLADPHGYIDFNYNGVSYSGFIHKIELSDNNRKANFELIARDNSIVYRTFTDGNNHVFTNDNQMINA